MRILVVCGAGASSTFVAQRLQRAATAAGLTWVVTAGTERTALSATGVDLVLMGPQISDRAAEIRDALAGRARVMVLPPDAFTDFDGSRVLLLARDAIAAPHDRKEIP